LFATGAADRWTDGIAVNALMPGNVASTALARHVSPGDLAAFGEQTELGLPPVKTIEQGAATSVLLAASPDVEGFRVATTRIELLPRRSVSVPATLAESRHTRWTSRTRRAYGGSPKSSPIREGDHDGGVIRQRGVCSNAVTRTR
jgi:hypothetical protein